MPKVSTVITEEEMRVVLQELKENKELSVTKVRDLLKVGYTKARRLLDEAQAGQIYVPPVDVPASTDDKAVIQYIQQLIGEHREVKPDVLRRDLNIGYKRAKRLIDSLGGNRAGVTVIPALPRRPRCSKKRNQTKLPKIIVKARAKIKREEEDDPSIDEEAQPTTKRRRTCDKRIPDVRIQEDDEEDQEDEEEEEEEEEEEDEDEDEVDEDEDEEDLEEEHEEEEKPANVDAKKKMEHLLKGIGICAEGYSSGEIEYGDLNTKHDDFHHESDPANDETHAHIMLMLQEGTQSSDEAEKSSRQHKPDNHHTHGHHHGHHSHRHHSHHHDGHHSHHHRHHEGEHHHHSHHHKDKDTGHHHHHHSHGHHHHRHHHSHRHSDPNNNMNKMSISAINNDEDGTHTTPPDAPVLRDAGFSPEWKMEDANDDGSCINNDVCMTGCRESSSSSMCNDFCVQKNSGAVEQATTA